MIFELLQAELKFLLFRISSMTNWDDSFFNVLTTREQRTPHKFWQIMTNWYCTPLSCTSTYYRRLFGLHHDLQASSGGTHISSVSSIFYDQLGWLILQRTDKQRTKKSPQILTNNDELILYPIVVYEYVLQAVIRPSSWSSSFFRRNSHFFCFVYLLWPTRMTHSLTFWQAENWELPQITNSWQMMTNWTPLPSMAYGARPRLRMGCGVEWCDPCMLGARRVGSRKQ
jgi:hypothetical protein